MKRLILGAAGVIAITVMIWRNDDSVAATATSSSGASRAFHTADVSDEVRAEFMRKKLTMVSHIVEGLAVEDFELVGKGALQLAELSESAAWKAPDDDPYYEYYSGNFDQAARQLIQAAETGSVEKATYAYMHVTVSCTACHQHVRGRVRVAAPGRRTP